MNVLGWVLVALGRGTDVYLFLVGMMALAGFAQLAGIFEWVAAIAVRCAGPSRLRFFVLVYAAGVVTTAFFSNDATIVALTPAVIGALRRYGASPLPYVVACALVANAASFLLPISNPSNLLVFAGHMPELGAWLRAFALPSCAAIAVSFALACVFFRRDLRGNAATVDASAAARPATYAFVLLALAAAAMVATSARGGALGAATFACGAAVWLVTLARDRAGAARIAGEISWRIVALTAILFVAIAALDQAGGFALSRGVLAWCAQLARPWSSVATGFVAAAASNAINNLPAGLNLGATLPAMHAGAATANAALIGVNLGPNATVNGSLATLLWLRIVRRAAIDVPPFTFMRAGAFTAIPALVAALVLV